MEGYIENEFPEGDIINYNIPALGESPDRKTNMNYNVQQVEEDESREILDFTEGFEEKKIINININEPFESTIFVD